MYLDNYTQQHTTYNDRTLLYDLPRQYDTADAASESNTLKQHDTQFALE